MKLYDVNGLVTILFYALILPIFFACSQVEKQSASAKPVIDIAGSASRIKYSGKAAGASAMLMSSMGPAGVAVGLAIDEGIGKDIHASFVSNGYDLNRVIEAAVASGMDQVCTEKSKMPTSFDCKRGALFASVDRVALRAKPKDGDYVIADIKILFRYARNTRSLDSRADEMCTDKSEPLDGVKMDGSKTNSLITSCINELTVFALTTG